MAQVQQTVQPTDLQQAKQHSQHAHKPRSAVTLSFFHQQQACTHQPTAGKGARDFHPTTNTTNTTSQEQPTTQACCRH
jgi:hypothetical protein